MFVYCFWLSRKSVAKLAGACWYTRNTVFLGKWYNNNVSSIDHINGKHQRANFLGDSGSGAWLDWMVIEDNVADFMLKTKTINKI